MPANPPTHIPETSAGASPADNPIGTMVRVAVDWLVVRTQIRKTPRAKTQGAAIIADMRQQATEESSRLLSNAKAQIEAERATAVTQLRTEVGGLATALAGRIIGESLDDDARAARTVDRFIADLEAHPAGQA